MHADHDLLSNDLVRAVDALAEAFAVRSVRHALIGGLAASMRGRPRFTQDVEPLEWSAGHKVRVATAEGLILTKLVAFRPRDQEDIETLLTANRDEIDIGLIREQWSPFADIEAERTAWLEAAIARRVVRRE